MLKAPRILLLMITLMTLFGLLVLPGLASTPKAPYLPSDYTSSDVLLRSSLEITFTPVATVFLPIIERPFLQDNNLEIVALNYASQDEYVTIKNHGPNPQSMNGWKIISLVGPQTYNFPDGIILGANQTLRVHSGPAAPNSPPNNLFWTDAFIWNNAGDRAELRDGQESLYAIFCYLDGCP